MATPATFKQIEEKQKARETRMKHEVVLAPLSQYGYRNNYSNYRTPKIDFTDDRQSYGGRQYTSFENKPRNGGKKKDFKQAPPPKLSPQEFVEVPLDGAVETDPYMIDVNTLISFRGPDQFLSTLYPAKVSIDDNQYLSVEHYYQACKVYSLVGPQHALELRNIIEPIRVKVAAKKILRQLGVANHQIEDWKRKHGFVMLYHATVYKFFQNKDLWKKLVDTGDAILAHAYERDNLFACGMDEEQLKLWAKEHNGEIIKIPSITYDNLKHIPLVGQGKNLVGAICMKVRKDLQKRVDDRGDFQMDQMAGLFDNLAVESTGKA